MNTFLAIATIWLLVSLTNIIIFRRQIFLRDLKLVNKITGIFVILLLGPIFIPIFLLIVRSIQNIHFEDEEHLK
jgi:hypothetical protein